MYMKTTIPWLLLLLGFAEIVFAAVLVSSVPKSAVSVSQIKKPMSHHANIIKDTQENENFRKVMFTGANSQLVVMSIPPGGEVGAETHK